MFLVFLGLRLIHVESKTKTERTFIVSSGGNGTMRTRKKGSGGKSEGNSQEKLHGFQIDFPNIILSVDLFDDESKPKTEKL